jgi:catechol 1,2-dioxygenase
VKIEMKQRMTGRREFLRNTTLVAISVTLPGLIACDDEKSVEPPDGSCITTADILGPFYRSGAPFREDVVPPGNAGIPLVIDGRVFADCETGLKNAVVEIWNADEEGAYDQSTGFNFRGRYLTGDHGAYRFRTIIPGRYLNGGTFRPSHIHFRITAAGYNDLISQIYFKDDPFIAEDPWASDSKASERILTLDKDASGTDTVNFDIYLTKA